MSIAPVNHYAIGVQREKMAETITLTDFHRRHRFFFKIVKQI